MEYLRDCVSVQSFKSDCRHRNGIRLRAERIGFAVEFLCEEVELPTDRPALAEQFAGGIHMGMKAVDFLCDVGLGRQNRGLSVQAVGIKA